MGYFRRAVRRRRARGEAVAFRERGRLATLPTTRLAPAPSLLRFVIETPDGSTAGLFRTSELIEDDDGALPAEARAALEAAYAWFGRHLPVPRRIPREAVCWFRADAAEMVVRLRTIAECYRMAGRQVWQHATRSPGRVVYEDRWQVVAVPYADQRRTASVW